MATEKRLIDAGQLKTDMYLIATVCNTETIFIDAIIDEIDNADDVDAVEVVRCKDCVKRGNDEECPMLSIMQYTEADDFCSFSVKVDGNG